VQRCAVISSLTGFIHTPSVLFGPILHVEYAERGKEYGTLFISSLFCEYLDLEYVRIHVIYKVEQVEYVIRALVVAPPEQNEYLFNT